MDFNESYGTVLGSDFDMVDTALNFLQSTDPQFSYNDAVEQDNDQLSYVIKNLDFDLDSNDKILSDFPAFDVNKLDSDFGSQIFCDNYNSFSASSSDSGNGSPTCSTSDDQNVFTNEQLNIMEHPQIHQLNANVKPVPDPSRLIPVNIPIQNIVTNSNNSITNNPVICIMPAASQNPIEAQPCVNQIKQFITSPKREATSPAPTFISTFGNVQATVYGFANNVFNKLSNNGVQYSKSNQITKNDSNQSVSDVSNDYDRKKENRKIRNRYSAQLSRIRKRNAIEEMKRNLINKDVLIEKLKNEIDDLKKSVVALRKENEALKSGVNSQDNNGRLGIVAGATCLFAVISLFTISSPYTKNLDSTQNITSIVAMNYMNSNNYPSKSVVRTGRALLSYDYEGATPYASNEDLGLNSKSSLLSQPNLSITANCGTIEKKYLNQSEAMRLNDDVFAWINRHECLQFMRIRRIFRVPINSSWETRNQSAKTMQKTGPKLERSKRVNRDNRRQRRTAIDKREDARIKAVRERAWRHIDLISTNGDSASIKSQLKAMDYDIASRGHIVNSWLQRKSDELITPNIESQYAELARNLKQREDTLYVVSMKDYYLLPPTERNGTMQPRMALILPALSFNGTLPNQIAMMRLECDITGTGLFHLPSSLLPLFHGRSSRQ